LQAFTPLTPSSSVKKQGKEYIWNPGQDETTALFAGAQLGDEIVRVRLLRGPHVDEARYQLVDGREGTLPYHSWSVIQGDEAWPAAHSDAEAIAAIEPYLDGFSLSSTHVRLARPLLPKERIYGLGERTGSLDKRGQAFPVWNLDFPGHHDDNVTTMYTSIPFYIGLRAEEGRAYGVLIDHTGHTDMDLGKTDPQLATVTREGDNLVAYFFAGPTPADVLRQYTELTGRMPLPARWALGYHQCRWGYISEQDIIDVTEQLRARHHPSDGIWLDIDYMDGYRNFTWNPQHFPDPARMTQRLHEQGFHLITILDPGNKQETGYDVYDEGVAKDYFCSYENGEYYVGSVWPGASVFPDFSRGEVRKWWGDLYQRLLNAGVDGIWNDMDEPACTNSLVDPDDGEPSLWGKTMDLTVLHRAGGTDPTDPDGPPALHKFFHNAFGMEMARSTYEGLLRARPDSRPFVLTRSGTTGMQRYAALWTGDNDSSWEHIRLALRMCLNVGVSGVPFVGSDIGGFWGNSNGELLTRFVQLGAFLPFCRNHNATGNIGQEPWAFGEPYESAYRKAIETRYRLMPYLYTLFQQATQDGTPVMRPLYFHYPQDEQACEAQTEFLVGDALLSAPISEEGATSRQLYLPEGTWFDYWDGTAYDGKQNVDIVAPLDRWPLLVRANSILPSEPVVQYAGQRTSDPITFTCFMTTDGEASFTLYEDDGETQAYRKGAFALTTVHCRVAGENVTVEIQEQHEGYKPRREEYEIIVRVNGRVLQHQARSGQGKVTVTL